MSWAKISFAYSIFYAFLGAFFIGMLSVFFQVMPIDKPTYYGEDSTMAQKGLNPGMGFRPQIDVENRLIAYNPSRYEDKAGYKQYTDNLRIFLESKYADQEDAETLSECVDGQDYTNDFMEGKSCKFDYKKIFENTNCTAANEYGYKTNKPCVLVKLNKIVSWVPRSADNKVTIKCEGMTSVDKDNLKFITYHSEGVSSDESGFLSAKYFPYFSQKSYRAPFVWVQFDLASNIMVNVRCKAEAENIDNEDNSNMRGQTVFSLMPTSY